MSSPKNVEYDATTTTTHQLPDSKRQKTTTLVVPREEEEEEEVHDLMRPYYASLFPAKALFEWLDAVFR